MVAKTRGKFLVHALIAVVIDGVVAVHCQFFLVALSIQGQVLGHELLFLDLADLAAEEDDARVLVLLILRVHIEFFRPPVLCGWSVLFVRVISNFSEECLDDGVCHLRSNL